MAIQSRWKEIPHPHSIEDAEEYAVLDPRDIRVYDARGIYSTMRAATDRGIITDAANVPLVDMEGRTIRDNGAPE